MTDSVVGRIGARSVVVQGQEPQQLLVDGVRLSQPGNHVQSATTVRAGEDEALLWTERPGDAFDGEPQEFYAVRRPDGELTEPRPVKTFVRLQSGSFDPTTRAMTPPDGEEGSPTMRLGVLQLATQMVPGYREVLESHGVELGGYVQGNAYLARLPSQGLEDIKALPFVRAVADFRPKDRCGQVLQAQLSQELEGEDAAVPYDIVPLRPQDKAALAADIRKMGGHVVTPDDDGGLLLKASLRRGQLEALLAHDQVTWIDASGGPEYDVDVLRVQGGANYVNQATGGDYQGEGLKGHLLEGLDPKHPQLAGNEFRDAPIAVTDGRADAHGHQTAGIVYGGEGPRPQYKGMLPRAQAYYTNAEAVTQGAVSRYELSKELIEKYHVMFQTASWGGARTTEYNALSAELDDLIFRLNFIVTQSQSNAGNRNSRPQAWAKNCISVGAANHFDTADMSDDKWQKTASIGPATDGRIKPDIAGPFDFVRTTSLSNTYTDKVQRHLGGHAPHQRPRGHHFRDVDGRHFRQHAAFPARGRRREPLRQPP